MLFSFKEDPVLLSGDESFEEELSPCSALRVNPRRNRLHPCEKERRGLV